MRRGWPARISYGTRGRSAPMRRSQTSAPSRLSLRLLVLLSLLVQPMLADWSSLPPVGTGGAGSSAGLATLGRALSEALPLCSDNNGAFDAFGTYTALLGFGPANCASSLRLLGSLGSMEAAIACALTIEQLASIGEASSVSWVPPAGSESTGTVATLCPESCAAVGVYAAGCVSPLPPQPPTLLPTPSPPPPSPPPLTPPPVAPPPPGIPPGASFEEIVLLIAQASASTNLNLNQNPNPSPSPSPSPSPNPNPSPSPSPNPSPTPTPNPTPTPTPTPNPTPNRRRAEAQSARHGRGGG